MRAVGKSSTSWELFFRERNRNLEERAGPASLKHVLDEGRAAAPRPGCLAESDERLHFSPEPLGYSQGTLPLSKRHVNLPLSKRHVNAMELQGIKARFGAPGHRRDVNGNFLGREGS